MDIKNLKRDSASVEGGTWVSGIPEMGTLRLKVRGFGSIAYDKAMTSRRKALDRSQKDETGAPSPEALDRIIGEAMHEAILLEWDGLTDNGKPYPFDKDLAEIYLLDPDYRPFRQAVSWAANYVDGLRAKEAEGVKKN